MRIHWLQHVPFEGLGSIEPWIKAKGYELSMTCLYAGEKPPSYDDFDWLIVMGGPMNIYQQAEYPWLIEEKLCIKRAIKHGKKLLGICLGAQLIADVLQARTYTNPDREIGWFSVDLSTIAANSPLFRGISRNFEAFHWHGDTFGIPDGAIHAARSKACVNQAFAYDGRIIGLQFHLETTPASAALLLEHCGDELSEGGEYVQSAEQILANPARFEKLNANMAKLLENLDES